MVHKVRDVSTFKYVYQSFSSTRNLFYERKVAVVLAPQEINAACLEAMKSEGEIYVRNKFMKMEDSRTNFYI